MIRADDKHDRDLAAAFDGQAARFERAPVQSDPEALKRLVGFADLPPDSLVLDAGCGPGLVAEAFLQAGHRVVGIDLSTEMVQRAMARCRRFGDRARFLLGSVLELDPGGPFDAAVSRYVIHHLARPADFVARLSALLRPGGILAVSDHTTDPDPERSTWHRHLETARDRTHTTNLTPGALADLLASARLESISLVEESFQLDFDEWFDRGTPSRSKHDVRTELSRGGSARGFSPQELPDGGLTLHCWRALVRGIRPGGP